ncbi:MAG: DUF6498-containing protein [Candidatus Poribacteria bacterium]
MGENLEEHKPGQGKWPSKLSIASLLIANLIPLIGVLFFGWDSNLIIIMYWAESAIIGFYTILKIIIVVWVYKGEILTINKQPVKITGNTILLKMVLALVTILFFIIHYGGFMAAHLMALSYIVKFDQIDIADALGYLGFIFASHGVSFLVNFVWSREYETATTKGVMVSPYIRIMTMQFAIFIGSVIGVPAAGLPIVKTFFDLLAHVNEHKQKNANV